jgi:glycosyltransferase involved in cell wall biosynthesis
MQKIIGIFAVKIGDLPPWDPDTIHQGITGSEEAVIYMSQELAKLGYKVLVFNDVSENSPHTLPTANPRFINPTLTRQMPNRLDVAIFWRNSQMIALAKDIADQIYLWPHDSCSPCIPEEDFNRLDDVLWLSRWQRQQWINANPQFEKFTKIFGNGVCPSQFPAVQDRSNPYSCIYASNYSRGLPILLACWPKIKKFYPRATLDIYYGAASMEKILQKKIDQLASYDVVEHGLVGHKRLAQAFSQSSFWPYACTHTETFCITALKAQLAGAIPVIIKGSALEETVRHGFNCNNKNNFESLLTFALSKAETISIEERKKMGEFVLQEFTWKQIAINWHELFEMKR